MSRAVLLYHRTQGHDCSSPTESASSSYDHRRTDCVTGVTSSNTTPAKVGQRPSALIVFLPALEKGGVERNAIIFANAMSAAGHAVFLLSRKTDPGQVGKLVPAVRVIGRSNRRIIGLPERLNDALFCLIAGLAAVRRLKKMYRRCAIFSFQSNVGAILLSKLADVPVAVRISNHFASLAFEGSVLRRVSEWAKILTYRHADQVIANSSELAHDYEGRLRCPVKAIPNPIDFAAIKRDRTHPIDPDILASATRPVFVTAGRLVQQKNYPMLLDAFRQVVDVVPASLVLIGDGQCRSNLERRARQLGLSDRVFFLGYKATVCSYLSHCDYFVLSSHYEGMPNVLVEAIATGLPAISTACKSGPREILLDGEGGLIVPSGDSKSLADAMLDYIRHPEAARERHQKAYSALNRFEKDKIVGAYAAIVECLLNKTV